MSRNNQLSVHSMRVRRGVEMETTHSARSSVNDIPEKTPNTNNNTAKTDRNANDSLMDEIKMELEQVNRLTFT